MTKTYGNDRTLIICLLIALILHLFLALTLFIKFDDSNKVPPFTKNIPNLKPESAPVVFYEEEKEPEPKKDIQKISNLRPNSSNSKTKEQDDKKEPQEKIDQLQKKDLIKKEIEAAEKLLKPIEIDEKPKPRLTERAKLIEEQSKKLREKIDAHKNIQPKEIKEPPKKPTLNIDKKHKESSTIAHASRLIQSDQSMLPKLANLTKGFINYMKEEGNNQFLERKGDSDKIDPHEAKLISYYNKIISFFHKASRPKMMEFNRVIEAYISRNSGSLKIEVGIKLIINKDGSLADIILMHNSGFNAYDNYIIKTFEDAAPFPPVPDHLSKDEFIFPIIIYTPLDRPGFSLRIG
jgi:hypothetical protein